MLRSLIYPALLAFGLAGCIRGALADRETRTLCQKDGGIHVTERVQLPAGRFPTIIPDKGIPTWKPVEGVIFEKYRYSDSYETISSHGYTIYKHRKQLKRIDDGKLMAELIQYVRQGEPEFRGIVCPEALTTEKLINSVFFVPNERTDPYQDCPAGNKTQRAVFERPASQERIGTRQRILNLPNNRTWARGIGCDERTAIDLWSERYGDGGRRLTATRLLFFSEDGRRCQAFALADSRSIVCTPDGVFALGFRRPDQSFVIQKFSVRGHLETEAELAGVAPGLLAGYREDASRITVFTAETGQGGYADCYASSLEKEGAKNGTAHTRIGPPDGPLEVPECVRPR